MSTSSASTLSLIRPAICACIPQELLPSIPPIVQWSWVAGSGPTVSPCTRAASRTRSSTIPGSTRTCRFCGSSQRIFR